MRRIPCPSRAINPSATLSPLVRHRVAPSPCRAALAAGTHLRPTAAFSTSASRAFLLQGKQDKKKHQAMVRRWQKRLLGDSEPIGARVDPYDPTSPIRIAPEEQGEEEEVLVDEHGREIQHHEKENVRYRPAMRGYHLRHVGGEEWIKHKEEADMAKEFEKLTLRTYTPLNDKMANQIEDLTGTPYTLRDENLSMAQDFYDFTGLPYTDLSFGRTMHLNALPDLRKAFHQAVVEVYTLKQAGLDMDLARLPNRGVYYAPEWIHGVKLHQVEGGELALAFPKRRNGEQLVHWMQYVPTYDAPEQAGGAVPGEDLLAEEGEVLAEGSEDAAFVGQPAAEPDTPSTRKAALVKQDDEKKAFDFMSNRPVPRAQSAPVAHKVEAKVQEIAESVASSPVADMERAAAAAALQLTGVRRTVLESAAGSIEKKVAALREEIHSSMSTLVGDSVSVAPELPSRLAPESKWRHLPLTDPIIKFALSKRLIQLTGLRISDPHLTTVETLGDLYGYLCAATKPKTKKLHSVIHIEAAKANRSAKLQAEAGSSAPKKASVSELISLGNVSLHKQKITPVQKRKEIGLEKVYRYATAERGLTYRNPRTRPPPRTSIPEGSRAIPEFGKPIPGKKWQKLLKQDEEKREARKQQRLKDAAS